VELQRSSFSDKLFAQSKTTGSPKVFLTRLKRHLCLILRRLEERVLTQLSTGSLTTLEKIGSNYLTFNQSRSSPLDSSRKCSQEISTLIFLGSQEKKEIF